MFRNYTKRFLNLELNMTFDNKCVILMSPLTMATMTPMANLDTKSWLSSMVVTIFVKHPSNAYLNKQAVASRYSAFCFNLTYGLIRSPVESELFDTPVSEIFFQNLLSRSSHLFNENLLAGLVGFHPRTILQHPLAAPLRNLVIREALKMSL